MRSNSSDKHESTLNHDDMLRYWEQTDVDDSMQPLSLFDCFVDMYSSPENISLRPIATGDLGFKQDATRIRGYFRQAFEQCGIKHIDG